MGFNRVPVDDGGRLPSPSRAGVGFIANVTPVNFNTETDETLTVADIGGGSVNQGLTLTSDVIYTLPTAALIIAQWPEMDVGDSYTFYVGNSQAAAYDVVIAAGVGITAIGTNNSLSVPPQAGRMFTLTKTAAATMDLY
jgi:hypothetical protein